MHGPCGIAPDSERLQTDDPETPAANSRGPRSCQEPRWRWQNNAGAPLVV